MTDWRACYPTVCTIVAAIAVATFSCLPDQPDLPNSFAYTSTPGSGGTTQIVEDLDKESAQQAFQTTTDLMRFVVAPTCAAENNECHNNEDFPDMSSEGNLWNLVDLPCNLGVGERETIEDYCEAVGDEIRVNGGATATVGSVAVVNDANGDFDHYLIIVDEPLAGAASNADFVILRGGVEMPQLGIGNSLEADSGSTELRIYDTDDIPDVLLIAQGDENKNGNFGDGSGVIVKPGDAHGSYIVWRLMAEQTERVQMPLNENADNPTEENRVLSPDEMYALMSWINCMQPDDSVYADIHYDCPANDGNEGVW